MITGLWSLPTGPPSLRPSLARLSERFQTHCRLSVGAGLPRLYGESWRRRAPLAVSGQICDTGSGWRRVDVLSDPAAVMASSLRRHTTVLMASHCATRCDALFSQVTITPSSFAFDHRTQCSASPSLLQVSCLPQHQRRWRGGGGRHNNTLLMKEALEFNFRRSVGFDRRDQRKTRCMAGPARRWAGRGGTAGRWGGRPRQTSPQELPPRRPEESPRRPGESPVPGAGRGEVQGTVRTGGVLP